MTRAMTAYPTDHGPRALRIGIVRDGRILEERLIREPGPVTIGRVEGADLLVSEPALPARAELFAADGGAWVLCGKDGMEVRVAHGGAPAADLSGAGRHRLAPDARGKIKIGAVTLLFQLVEPPPRTPRPQLPAAVRAGLLGQVDWPFTSSLTMSFVAFFALVVVLDGTDWPMDDVFASLTPQEIRLYIPEPEPPPEPEETGLVAPDSQPDEEEPVASNDERPSRDDADRGDRPRRDRPAAPDPRPSLDVDEQIAAAVSDVIGRIGEDDGALADMLRPGQTHSSDVMADAQGTQQADGSASMIRPRGPTGPARPTGPIGTMRRTHQDEVDEGGPLPEREIEHPTVRTPPPRPPPEIPDDFYRIVVSRVRARTRAIQACYEHQLGPHPDLAGRVDAEFTVQMAGNVSGFTTTGPEPLGRCVSGALGSMRFSPGPEEPYRFRFPFIFNTPQR
jgi:hypothetical protein